jgi:hypothetical protein
VVGWVAGWVAGWLVPCDNNTTSWPILQAETGKNLS